MKFVSKHKDVHLLEQMAAKDEDECVRQAAAGRAQMLQGEQLTV
jgi:hypothetical protein